MLGFDGTGGEADGLAEALTFLERPICRSVVTRSVDAEAGWGGVGSVGADAGSFIARASDGAPCRAILAAKASSTSLASSADRRVLAFKMAIARACKSSCGDVSISWMSPALIAADSSALSFLPIGGELPFRNGLALGAG